MSTIGYNEGTGLTPSSGGGGGGNATYVTNDPTYTNTTDIAGNLSVTCNVTVGSNLTVNGPTTMLGGLTVRLGDVTLGGGLSITNTVRATADVNVGGNLIATYTTGGILQSNFPISSSTSNAPTMSLLSNVAACNVVSLSNANFSNNWVYAAGGGCLLGNYSNVGVNIPPFSGAGLDVSGGIYSSAYVISQSYVYATAYSNLPQSAVAWSNAGSGLFITGSNVGIGVVPNTGGMTFNATLDVGGALQLRNGGAGF